MQTNTDISSVFNPIDDAIGSIMESFGLSGLAVGIVKKGETVYASGFGVTPPVIAPLCRVLEEKGQEAAIALYHELQHNQPEAYDFNPEHFADSGYLLIDIKRNSQAMKILTLGMGIYPDADTLYAVLALMNVKNGDRKQALENIQQCLKLNPENRFAKSFLNDLNEEDIARAYRDLDEISQSLPAL
jgi:tetratricopeptide (TPR) repeat protein